MKYKTNPYFGKGLNLPDTPLPAFDPKQAIDMIKRCPRYAATPLEEKNGLYIKDERSRMGLGAFKATGAAYVIACDAQEKSLQNVTYVTASAGNHGLSVAAGATAFGARSVVYLSQTVPEGFAERLRQEGAEVVIEGKDYQESMDAAAKAASDNDWILLSDGSWEGYLDIPHRLMEGYLILGAEIADEISSPPTHIFLQAGVGGLACAIAAFARFHWGEAPHIIVVEPEEAPALYESIEAGAVVDTKGGVSSMGRLDCKTPSRIALNGLSKHANDFLLITDAEVEAQLPKLADMGFATSPSGGAALAAYLALNTDERAYFKLDDTAVPLFIISEGDA